MAQAEAMVAAYVGAGFEKIHLDTSMGCKGEPDCIPAELAARRAARLAVVAEKTGAGTEANLRYVVGTEVPTPGGAKEEIERLEVTRPEAVVATVEEHRRAFAAAGAPSASEDIVAVVVQPGIEFDDQKVVVYRPEPAARLRTALAEMPGLVFEAHSTDYQPPEALAQLVRDGFAILKVGPALTFAFRRALYALDRTAAALDRSWSAHRSRPRWSESCSPIPGTGSPITTAEPSRNDGSATSATAIASATTGPLRLLDEQSSACWATSAREASRRAS